MITCTRLIQFCSGHRVVGHENKCANVHGHNYMAEVTAVANELDGIGRVIDFSALKERVGGWIDEHLDHTFIASPDENQDLVATIESINNKRVYHLPNNPTAENIADHLLNVICPIVMQDTGVEVVKIVLWETPNCHATVTK